MDFRKKEKIIRNPSSHTYGGGTVSDILLPSGCGGGGNSSCGGIGGGKNVMH